MPLIGMSSQTERSEFRRDKNNIYILKEQLNYMASDLFDKIPSDCVMCKSNTGYQVLIKKVTGQGGLGSFGEEIVYWCRCDSCSDRFEITYEDYLKIKPILKLNINHVQGKTSQDTFMSKVEDVQKKIYKKNVSKRSHK